MDWAGWALFGLIATAALTAVMIAAQLAGLTRLDLPLVLGTLVTEDPDRARVAGFFIHLAVGQGFALGYAATLRPVGPGHLVDRRAARAPARRRRPHPCSSPLLAGVHPRMASHRAGPPAPPRWSHPASSPSTTASDPARDGRRPPGLRHPPRRAPHGR